MALSKPQVAQTPGDRFARVGAVPRWEVWLQWLALVVVRLGLADLFLPRITLAAFALSGLLLYPAYSALRPLLGWPGDGVGWQLLVLVLLYLPPLLILAARRLRSRWVTGAAPFAAHAQESS